MKICEYVNNLLSLSLFLYLKGKIYAHYSKYDAIKFGGIVYFYPKLPEKIFLISARQKRHIPLRLRSSSIENTFYADEMIRKYGIIPLGLIIIVNHKQNEIILREIIRAINPDEISIKFGD